MEFAGTDRRSRVGANTGDTGFIEGKKGGGITGAGCSWDRSEFDFCDEQFSGQGDGTESRERVPWKSENESSTGRLEAVGQVLLLSRWQVATRRPGAPCKFLLKKKEKIHPLLKGDHISAL